MLLSVAANLAAPMRRLETAIALLSLQLLAVVSTRGSEFGRASLERRERSGWLSVA
jgi:hypothetical protein